ncbi:hypothetical protein BH23BAC4_BH23BAC4_03730 [soil metagenome]
MDKQPISRRDSLKALTGAVVLGTALGVPSAALAAGASGRAQIKFTLDRGRSSDVIHSWDVPDQVLREIAEGTGRLQIKWYDRTTRQYLESVGFDRRQLKIDSIIDGESTRPRRP